jgi:hypothetical protein
MPRSFWFHPESASFWASDDRDPDLGDGLSIEIERGEYLDGIREQFLAEAPSRTAGQRVVVFGGRDFDDEPTMFSALDDFHHDLHMDLLIEGEQDGADKMARRWAESRGVSFLPVEAKWEALGGVAGNSRNQRMLDEGRPHCGIAFKGGSGTADMKSRCELAGVPVFEIAT